MFEKTIFIAGGPCSGTTWLNRWLKQHFDIAGSPEIWAADSFCYLRNHLLKSGWYSHDTVDLKIRQIFEKLFFDSSISNNKKYLLHHNTRISGMIPSFKQVFPNAYYIFMLRDGRRVLAALKAKWYLQKYKTSLPYYLVQAAKKWIFFADSIISNKLPQHSLLLRYENIHVDIDQEIVNFLGIDLHNKIDLNERVNSNFETPKPENYWEEYLDSKEKILIQQMNPYLEKLGYFITDS